MNMMLNTSKLPYCRGCGHDLIAKSSARALEGLKFNALDVIIVTDIGCHGIIDRCLNTHTVHGLHGRSPALAAGIALAAGDNGKKVIVFIGDGGSTIGLQHILEAARLNIPMTVIVHNNMLYGMTGGQSSGLTPCGFRTSTSTGGSPWSGYDICRLAADAGASCVSRVAGIGDISPSLSEVFSSPGFSLIEVVEICPGYGIKFNPGRKLSEIMKSSGRLPGKWGNKRDPFAVDRPYKTSSLFDQLNIIKPEFSSALKEPVHILISGSAGEGVQVAASFISDAAVRSGLQVTQKGSYPVTVGVGFSAAEMVISPFLIGSHGTGVPDVALVTSGDGLAYCRTRLEKMKGGMLFIDSGLEIPTTGAEVLAFDFRSLGSKTACLYALFMFAGVTGYLSPEAIKKSVEEMGLAGKFPVGRLLELISE